MSVTDNGARTITLASSGGGGGSGSLVLVEAHTANSSAELDFTTCISSTYDDYQVDVLGLNAATNGAAPILQFSTNGGTSYDTSSIYDWSNNVYPMGGALGSYNGQSSVNGISLFSDSSRSGLASGSTPGMTVSFRIADPLNTSNYKFVGGHDGVAHYTSGTVYSFTFGGQYRSIAAANAFRIIMTSGNIAAGTVRCYGIAH